MFRSKEDKRELKMGCNFVKRIYYGSIFLMLFLLGGILGCSKGVKGDKPHTVIPKKYVCHCIDKGIIVDGIINEPYWEKAEILYFILPKTYAEPISKTEGKLLWDKNYLYVSFKAYDMDIWSYLDKRDDHTYREDVLEIFLKTDYDKAPYYNFEINALNTIYDAFNIKREGGRRWAKWNCERLKSAVRIEGSLNNWKDEDSYWSMEVAIPFSSLPTLEGRSPEIGDTWFFHLARYDYSVYLPEWRELTSCAPLSRVDFHWVEDWLTLIFEF